MLINIIFFVTMIPTTFAAIIWLTKEMAQAFEAFQD